MAKAGFEPTYSDHEPEKLPLLYFAFIIKYYIIFIFYIVYRIGI